MGNPAVGSQTSQDQLQGNQQDQKPREFLEYGKTFISNDLCSTKAESQEQGQSSGPEKKHRQEALKRFSGAGRRKSRRVDRATGQQTVGDSQNQGRGTSGAGQEAGDQAGDSSTERVLLQPARGREPSQKAQAQKKHQASREKGKPCLKKPESTAYHEDRAQGAEESSENAIGKETPQVVREQGEGPPFPAHEKGTLKRATHSDAVAEADHKAQPEKSQELKGQGFGTKMGSTTVHGDKVGETGAQARVCPGHEGFQQSS